MGKKSGLKPWHFGVAIAVIVILIIATTTPRGQQVMGPVLGYTTSATGSQTLSGNLCTVTKPISITVYDALGGSALNAPTITVYNGATQAESSAASSSGVWTSGNKYVTNQQITIKESGASTVAEFIPTTIPAMTCGDTSTNNVFSFYAVTLGSWLETASAQGGTTFTTGSTYFFSQFPSGIGGTVTVSFSMAETVNNAGYIPTYDIVNGLLQSMVVQIKDTGSNLVLTGLPHAYSVGTTRYWLIGCPDGLSGVGYGVTSGAGVFQVTRTGNTQSAFTSLASPLTIPTGASDNANTASFDSICTGSLSQQKVGNSAYGGSASFNFGVSRGALASGSSEQLSITMNDYASINYFASQTALGISGTTAAVGAPQGSSQGTAFTITFGNA